MDYSPLWKLILWWLYSVSDPSSLLYQSYQWLLYDLWCYNCHIEERSSRCSLSLSPNALEHSPIYSSLQSTLTHLSLYITPPFLVMWSLSLGALRRPLIIWPPLKYTWPLCFLAFLKLSVSLWVFGTSMWIFSLLQQDVVCFCWLSLLLLLLFPGLGWWLFLYLILFNAYVGYFYFCNTTFRLLTFGIIAAGLDTKLWLCGRECFDTMFRWYSVVAIPLKKRISEYSFSV